VAIIAKTDLPSAVQSNELVDAMVAGANAAALRVAPCLSAPTTAWAASTAYALDDKVVLSGGEALQVTVAGTSGTVAPTAPALSETVTDGTVTWKRIAPTPGQDAEAKLILIGAVKRWHESSSGALSTQTAGPFGQTVDTRQRTGYRLWPSEIEELQSICAQGVTDDNTRAFSLRPSGPASVHQPWCDLNLGANYCSCGADIAGYPLYESGALSGDYY
jgi:hypothetical protein